MNRHGVCQKSLLAHIKKRIDTVPRKGFKSYGYSLYNASLYFKTFLRSTVQYYMCLLNQSNFHSLCLFYMIIFVNISIHIVFDLPIDEKHKCKMCKTLIKQKSGSGYGNLKQQWLTHDYLYSMSFYQQG